jgi:hypothetical protein
MAWPAWAQVNTSSIAGVVTDPSASLVPDASGISISIRRHGRVGPQPFGAAWSPATVLGHCSLPNWIRAVETRYSLKQARAEMNVLSRQYVLGHPGLADADPGSSVRVLQMHDQLVADVRPTLWMLFGAVGFVLLIACGNVASLLLARAASRCVLGMFSSLEVQVLRPT